MATVLENLIKARALIQNEKNWTKAERKKVVKTLMGIPISYAYCALGALDKVCGANRVNHCTPEVVALAAASPLRQKADNNAEAVWLVNDSQGHEATLKNV